MGLNGLLQGWPHFIRRTLLLKAYIFTRTSAVRIWIHSMTQLPLTIFPADITGHGLNQSTGPVNADRLSYP
jgi:hypothetical protein